MTTAPNLTPPNATPPRGVSPNAAGTSAAPSGPRTTALITGASSGLGAEFAAQLAASGHDLVLVARREAVLEEVAAPLRARHGVAVEILPADLSQRDQLERVVERIEAGGIDLLVNNAGYGPAAEFLDNDIAREEAMHAVMTTAILVLSHAAGRAMRAQRRGAIINVASMASFISGGTYSADKSWVLNFSEGLSQELRDSGVIVTAVCPGYTHTGFHGTSGWEVESLPEIAWLNAEHVVKVALQAARSRRDVVVPSARYRAVVGLIDSVPRGVVRTAVNVMRRSGLISEAGAEQRPPLAAGGRG